MRAPPARARDALPDAGRGGPSLVPHTSFLCAADQRMNDDELTRFNTGLTAIIDKFNEQCGSMNVRWRWRWRLRCCLRRAAAAAVPVRCCLPACLLLP